MKSNFEIQALLHLVCTSADAMGALELGSRGAHTAFEPQSL